ncbi:ribonuclease HII [Schaalia sp. ZJ405]|uniref:ribonuclease HII n=1 Tax=Schaalia sp. ZJ405 TaxID=2709403 RepID=UPI0013EA9C93|nr:ribonuclease HII [Schaalia sp. ZJ405]QPK81994.1 ribonuclease HII [Schaalia sp. ZJ405]
MKQLATSDVEQDFARRYGVVAGIDEVGRGSLAGPVAVGVALVDTHTGPAPTGLTDSKLLTAKRREALEPEVAQWVIDSEVGWASPAEIDAVGIIGALRLAGLRALGQLQMRGHTPGVILLDGSHNWLAAGNDLFSCAALVQQGRDDNVTVFEGALPKVVTHVKADAAFTVVSAASVLAKVSRDRLMASVDDPGYDWAKNKGYASRTHVAGLKLLGASDFHRRSWNLPLG